MPRGKKTALDASVEQAKAQGMKTSAKELKKQMEMEQSLADTLKKHREEMDRLAAEHEAENKQAEPAAPAKPETEQTEVEQPETLTECRALDYIEEKDEDGIYPLRDPTTGQDLTHNFDLTVSEFCEKTLSLLSAATQAVRSMELRFGNYETKINQLQEQIRNRAELELAVGFKYLSYGKWYTPRLKACPNCGRHPSLQKEKYDKGWMVICDECWTRSESGDGPMAAVKNWNDGKETEISRMLNEPLTSK